MDGKAFQGDRSTVLTRRRRRSGRGPRSLVAATAAGAAVVVSGIVTSCAPPPPVCPPSIRLAQKDAFVRGGGTWDEGAQWLFGWHWSNPDNCTEPGGGEPIDPETPEPVVPEAPLAVMLPLGAAAVGAGAAAWNRRRRFAGA